MFRKTLLRFRYGGAAERQECLSCPECGAGLVNIGRGFEPPRLHDIKNWKRVEQLYAANYNWYAASDGDRFAPNVRAIGTLKPYLQVPSGEDDRAMLSRAKEVKKQQRLQKQQGRLASRSRAGRSLTEVG